MGFVITIMGNIGSGKSTLIRSLNELKYSIIEEPIAKWGEWLELFYSNPSKYAFSFQMKVLMDFDIDKNIDKDLLIVERSPVESKEIFARTLLENKMINDSEFSLLCEYHNKIAWQPNMILYLKSTPEVCIERIHKRSRECENGISIKYLQQLHKNYEEFISNEDTIPIFEIDADKSAKDVLMEVSKLLGIVISVVTFNK